MKLNQLNEEQRSVLRGLHFWRRNLIIARRDNDAFEIKKSDEAIKYAFERADKHDIPFSIQNKVLHHAENNREEGFSDMAINQVDKIREAKNNQHGFKVVSLQNESSSDFEELAKVVITNGISGKEYSTSVWAQDRENNDLFPGIVFLSNPHAINYDNDNSDSLFTSSIDDLIRDSDEVERKIAEYAENPDKTFNQNIPPNQLNLDLHELVVDEEVGEFLLKSGSDTLCKEDIINFGHLVKDDSFHYNLGSHLGHQVQTIINENTFEAGEITALNKACEALDIEPNLKEITLTKEELQNLQVRVQSDLPNKEAEKVIPIEFLEKFQELNALDNKVLLNEDREKGTISIGALVEKEVSDSSDKYEFVKLSNMEMSAFDYNAAVSEKMKDGNDLGNLYVESLADRSKGLYSQKDMLTAYEISANEAKDFLLENSQVKVIDIEKSYDYIEKNGTEPELDAIQQSGMVKLNYELGTGNKYIELEEITKEPLYTPSYDVNGEETIHDRYDDIPTKTTFYELNDKELTFIDAKTNKEHPLEKVLSKQELQNFKESVESHESISITLDSEHVKNIKDLTKEHEKPFSSNKSQQNLKKNNKELDEHER